MELLKATLVLIMFMACVQTMTEAVIEPRKILHIPEKIIGGMIDIVQSHKSKPSQAAQQSQASQQVQVQSQQEYPQPYATWNSAYPTTAYSQNQFQSQGHYVNYGNYPIASGQAYPMQQVYAGSQNQAQSQQQAYPQMQSGNNFQAQNQQGFNGNIQSMPIQVQSFPNHQVLFQGQNQHSGQFALNQAQIQGQSQPIGQFNGNQAQIQGQNQQLGQTVVDPGQIQGQNQYSGQFGLIQGQLQNQGQYPSVGQTQTPQSSGMNIQTGSVFNGNPPGTSQLTGQNAYFQSQEQEGIGQNTGFQVINKQPPGSGPTCVCQAWTKPQPNESEGGAAKSEDTTKVTE